MDNEQLRTAITRAGLTLEEFADIVEVDPKTVRRWLAGRIPYARHRARAASALDMTEHALWPNEVAPPTGSPAPGQTAPAITDVVAGYGHATDRGAPDLADVLSSADKQIELLTSHISAAMTELLLAKAVEGCRARVIIENPNGQIERLLGIDGVEIHASSAGEDCGLCRADEQMLLELRGTGILSEPSPLIAIEHRTERGLFDRLTDAFEQCWAQTTPLATREHLHAYRPEIERSSQSEGEPDRTLPRWSLLDDGPRRWPGRRD